MLQNIASDFEASKQHGVFGTPTFVFENGSAFFMRIKAPEDPVEAERIFDALYELHVSGSAIDEVKRPQQSQD